MNKNKLIIKILSIAFICLMGVGMLAPLLASADSKDDYTAAQEKLDAINKEIANIKNQKQKQEAERKNAQTKIDLVKKQLDILLSQIDTTGEDLMKKQQELEQKKIDIQETDQLFQERLKAMYMMRNGGALSTILAVDSFSQLMTATDTLQRISVSDTDLLKKLDEEKRQIEKEEAEIQEQLDNLELKKKTQESKQNELASLLKQVNSQLSDLDAQSEAKKAEYEAAYQEYLAAKDAVEKEFGQGSTGDFVGGEWIWPVPSNRNISSPFGWRTLYGRPDNHIGIDISTGSGPYIYNKPIVASNSGVVKTAIYSNKGYGNYIIIDHGGNNFTLYGHCASLAVKRGDYVTQGQTIAYVGSTGNSTGAHLHFEIRLNGTPVDPAPLVAGTRP